MYPWVFPIWDCWCRSSESVFDHCDGINPTIMENRVGFHDNTCSYFLSSDYHRCLLHQTLCHWTLWPLSSFCCGHICLIRSRSCLLEGLIVDVVGSNELIEIIFFKVVFDNRLFESCRIQKHLDREIYPLSILNPGETFDSLLHFLNRLCCHFSSHR